MKRSEKNLDPRLRTHHPDAYPSRRPEYRRTQHGQKYRVDADYRARVQERERIRMRLRRSGMAAHEGSVCEICGAPDGGVNLATGTRRALSLDHDHMTGAFRGCLCTPCNTGLGMFRDDPTVLRAAIRYLSRTKEVTDVT